MHGKFYGSVTGTAVVYGWVEAETKEEAAKVFEVKADQLRKDGLILCWDGTMSEPTISTNIADV